MRQLLAWIHQLLLLPILLVLLVVCILRVGISSHPLYHQQVQGWLQQALGQAVKVEDFTLMLQGRQLSIDVQGVSVGQVGPAWQRLAFKLDVRYLLQSQQLQLSEVELFGLDLAIQETAQGDWQPLGLPDLENADADVSSADTTPAALLVLLNQAGSLALSDGRLTLLPRKGPPLPLHNLNAQIMPAGERAVALQWQASYPNTHGSISAVGRVQLSEDFAIEQAQAQIKLDKLPLAPVWQHFQREDWHSGQVSASAWLQLEEHTTKLQLRGIDLLSGYQGVPVTVRADADIASTADGWHLAVDHLAGGVGDIGWPLTNLQIDAVDDEWLLTSEHIDASPITPLLSQFPQLPAKVTDPIIGLAPQGSLHKPSFYWNQQQPKAFLFAASMDNASVAAWKGVPKVEQASGLIAIGAAGGKVSIDDQDGLQVHLPKLTSSGWAFDSMQGEVAWRFDRQFSYLQSSVVELTQADGRFKLHLGGQFPRRNVAAEASLQMRLGLAQVDVANLPDMLPDLTMGTALSAYLRQAANAGVIEEGGVTFNGLLGKSAKSLGPYAYSVPVWGEAILAKVKYSPSWPTMAAVELDFSSDHKRVSINLNKAEFAEFPDLTVNNWHVQVPMLNTVEDPGDASVDVAGQIAADAKLLLKAASTLPKEVVVPAWIADLQPQGHTQLQIKTSVPYGQQASSNNPSYDLQIQGQGLDAYWQEREIQLAAIDLSAHVSHKGLHSLSAQGFADGHRVKLSRFSEVGTDRLTYDLHEDTWQTLLQHPKGSAWLRLQGQLPSAYVLPKLGLGQLDMDDWLPVSPQVDVYFPECLLSMDACQQVMGNLRFREQPQAWPDIVHHAGDLSFSWHKHKQQQQLELANGRENLYLTFADDQWQGLGIGLDAQAPRSASGTHVNGKMQHVDAAYWFNLAQTGEESAESALGLPPVRSLSILSDTIQWQDLVLNSALLTYEIVDQGWAFGLLSDELAGHIFNAGHDTPWLVDIDHIRVTLPEEEDLPEGEEAKDLLADVDPAMLPSMDVEVHEITKNEQSFGRWSAKLRNDSGKVFVHDLEAQIHGSQLTGNLIWSKAAEQHKTAFSGRVVTNAVANTLEGFGYSPSIDSNYGAVEVQLSWPKSPLAFDIDYSTGDLALRIKQGEIAKTPDVANSLKVLSLLDMNRLMQRIRLDFTDVLNDEYVFNSIYAHYHFNHGVGRTVTPAEFKAPSLELSLEGSINFPQRLVYHDLYVTIPVVDKLPLAALIAGLPQLGGTLYIVDKLIGSELSTFTSFRYTVAGDLDRPEVELQQIFDKNNQPQSLDERINNVFKFQ